ncbi:MAG: hypothetical protein R3F37_20630 [Candidatus Competibacteraceae bacterium]
MPPRPLQLVQQAVKNGAAIDPEKKFKPLAIAAHYRIRPWP